jgi:hypothetical protein
MIRLTLFVVLAVLSATVGQSAAANGAGCDARNSPMQRQLVAIQRLEKQRQCNQRSLRGVFNGCRDLAQKRQTLQRELNATAKSACKRPQVIRSAPRAKASQAKSRQPAAGTDGSAHYCVRPSDGYFFPAPNSQFLKAEDIQNAEEQCRFICQDPTIELYRLRSFDIETENMVSLDGRTFYRDMPNAFRYRSASDFQACNHRRYYERVAELRARTVTPTDLSNAIIPVPTFRPEVQLVGNEEMAQDNFATYDAEPPISYEQTSALPNPRVIEVARPATP